MRLRSKSSLVVATGLSGATNLKRPAQLSGQRCGRRHSLCPAQGDPLLAALIPHGTTRGERDAASRVCRTQRLRLERAHAGEADQTAGPAEAAKERCKAEERAGKNVRYDDAKWPGIGWEELVSVGAPIPIAAEKVDIAAEELGWGKMEGATRSDTVKRRIASAAFDCRGFDVNAHSAGTANKRRQNGEDP